jgi:hypothetical protein
MSKYEDQLVGQYVEKELGKFINQNQDVLSTTVGETILIIQATTAYCDDLLQGLTEKWQRALVVESTLEHTKKLMLEKRGFKYESEKPKTKSKNRKEDY